MKKIILITALLAFIGCAVEKRYNGYNYEPYDMNILKFKETTTTIIEDSCSVISYTYYIRENKIADEAKNITMYEICETNGKITKNCKCSYSAALFNYEYIKDSSERKTVLQYKN